MEQGKIFKFHNDLDTDQIIASQYLLLPNLDEMKGHAFESLDHLFCAGSKQEMCIINNFPVGLCCYGCFEPDRCIGRKFVTHSKATLPLTVIGESATQPIPTGCGRSRSIAVSKRNST